MTDDLEPRLRARLDRLAQAVPVPPERALRPVASIAPRWRGGSANAGPGALVSVVLALGLVFGAVLLAGGSKAVGGVIDTTRDGMFELSIRSPRDRYAEDEPIEAVATLEYIGDDPSIEAFSYPNMPGFGVEQLDGPYRVGGSGGRASCVVYPFRRGELITYPFAKSAAFSAGDPDEAFIRAYLNLGSDGRIDPILRLPAGTWRIFTIADLYVGGCGGSEHRLEAGITVVVGPDLSTVPSSETPAPSPTPAPTASPSPSPTPSPSATIPPPQVAVPYPDGCAAYQLSDRRCAYIVDWAKDEAGIHPTDPVTVELLGDPDCFDPDPRTCGGMRTTSFIVRVRLTTPAGASSDHPVFCGLGGETSLLCTERPRIWTTTSTNGYTDVPCETENGPCATPLPTIDPAAAAAAVPLEVDALDIVIDHVGAYSIPVGEAVLPNGILSEVQFELADDMPSTVLLNPGFVHLEVTSLDGGPRFDNIYQHGWHEGTERVQVTLTFTVEWLDADTTLQLTNIRVH